MNHQQPSRNAFIHQLKPNPKPKIYNNKHHCQQNQQIDSNRFMPIALHQQIDYRMDDLIDKGQGSQFKNKLLIERQQFYDASREETSRQQRRQQRQIQRLRQKMNDIKIQNINLCKLNVEYQNEIKIWQQKAKRLNDQLIQYENHYLADLQSSNHQPNDFIQNEEIKKIKRQKQNLQEQIKNHVHQNNILTVQLAKYKEESKQVSNLQQQLYHFQKQFNHFQSTSEYFKSLSKDLYQKNQDLSASNIKLQLQLKNALQNIQKLSSIHENELENTKRQLSSLKQVQNTLSANVEQLKDKNIQLTLQKQVLQQQKASLQKQYQQKAHKNKEINLQKMDLQEKIEGLSNIIEKTQQQNIQLSIKMSKNISMNEHHTDSDLLAELQISQKQNRKLEAQLKVQKQQINSLKNVINKLKEINAKQLYQFKQEIQVKIQQKWLISANQLQNASKKNIENKELTLENQMFREEKRRLLKEIQIYKDKYAQTSQEIQIILKQLQYKARQGNQNELRIHQLQHLVSQLEKQNEKWKVYRLSEEDMARRQARQYKKRIDQLQLIVSQQLRSQKRYEGQETHFYKNKINQLEIISRQADLKRFDEIQSLNKLCQTLKEQLALQQKKHNEILLALNLQQQRKINHAMDEMEEEFKKLIKQFEAKVINLQQEKSLLSINIKEMRKHLQTLNNENFGLTDKQDRLQKELDKCKMQINRLQMIQKKGQSQITSLKDVHLNLKSELNELKKELMIAKGELNRCHSKQKRTQSQNQLVKNSIQTQKDIRMRYDRDMQQKVTEIQRLKLQVNHLSDQLKKNTFSKKQVQILETTIRTMQIQDRDSNQKNQYLQNMIQAYLTQIKTYKALKEKDYLQRKQLQNMLREMQQEMLRKQREVNLQKGKVLDLQQAIQDRKDGDSQWQHQAKHYRQRCQNLQRQLKDSKQCKNDMKNQINILQNKATSLKQRQRQLQKQNKDLSYKVQSLNGKLQQSKEQIISLNGSKLHLSTEIQKFKHQCVSLESNQAKFSSAIEDQKLAIQKLTKQNIQQLQQIQVLLTQIDQLQTDIKKNSASFVNNQQINKRTRAEYYDKISSTVMVNKAKRISFDGNQEIFLAYIYEAMLILNRELNDLLQENQNHRRTIVQLNQQKENINTKYLKYKNVALQYKNKKSIQKAILMNTYRFNQQVLSHCQDLIKRPSQNH